MVPVGNSDTVRNMCMLWMKVPWLMKRRIRFEKDAWWQKMIADCSTYTDKTRDEVVTKLYYVCTIKKCHKLIIIIMQQLVSIVQPVSYDCVDPKQILVSFLFCSTVAIIVHDSFHPYIRLNRIRILLCTSSLLSALMPLRTIVLLSGSSYWWLFVCSYAESQSSLIVFLQD